MFSQVRHLEGDFIEEACERATLTTSVTPPHRRHISVDPLLESTPLVTTSLPVSFRWLPIKRRDTPSTKSNGFMNSVALLSIVGDCVIVWMLWIKSCCIVAVGWHAASAFRHCCAKANLQQTGRKTQNINNSRSRFCTLSRTSSRAEIKPVKSTPEQSTRSTKTSFAICEFSPPAGRDPKKARNSLTCFKAVMKFWRVKGWARCSRIGEFNVWSSLWALKEREVY